MLLQLGKESIDRSHTDNYCLGYELDYLHWVALSKSFKGSRLRAGQPEQSYSEWCWNVARDPPPSQKIRDEGPPRASIAIGIWADRAKLCVGDCSCRHRLSCTISYEATQVSHGGGNSIVDWRYIDR
ncbi:MAG: hypothetical protein ACJA07_001476 [Rhodococcus sp. (in: high G+C Gram-positive bacteria)]|jgi:hypothetical protein